MVNVREHVFAPSPLLLTSHKKCACVGGSHIDCNWHAHNCQCAQQKPLNAPWIFCHQYSTDFLLGGWPYLWLNYPTSQNRSAVMVCSSNLDPGFQQHTFYIHHIAIMVIKMFSFFFLFATSNYNVWLRPLQSPSDWNGSTEEERLPTDSSLKSSVTNSFFFFLLELWW